MRNSVPERVLEVDTTVYRMVAIKKAAYKFGHRCHVKVTHLTHGSAQVWLQPKSQAVDIEQLAGEFWNELLDQELREAIWEETADIRNLLLAQAFSATSLVDPLGDKGDYASDPLDIRSREPK